MQQLMAEDTANKHDSGFEGEAEKFDELKTKRPFGPKSTKEAQQARIQRLYKRQLEGLPVRQLVMEHAAKEQIGIATAWRDWTRVVSWNETGWNEEKETILSRIQAMRMRIIDQAVKKGQLQTAMMGLKDLQETLLGDTNGGESTVKLNINIENKSEQ